MIYNYGGNVINAIENLFYDCIKNTFAHVIEIYYSKGWIGLVLIVAACLSAGYLGTSLAKCWLILEERKPEYRKGSRSPYSDIGYEAFGKKGRLLLISDTTK